MVLKILSDALMGDIEMLEIAICDDNVEELNHVAKMVQDIFVAKKIKHELSLFTFPNELLKHKGRFDIVILDIVMGEYNGIDVGRKLKEKDPDISLIYTTSYEQYVMQAINDAHAYSYLCKPINKEKMRQQLGAVLTRLPDRMAEKEFHKVIDSNNKEHVMVKLKVKDILYFEYIKGQRKVTIVLQDEKYVYDCTFERVVDEFSKYDFAVNCRGNLVNLCRIAKIKGYAIFLDNGTKLPLSQRRIGEFRESLSDFLQRNV